MASREILIADSDGRMRAVWRTGLERMGFHVREQADGPSALRAARNGDPVLLITELYIPCGAHRCLVRATRDAPELRPMKILVVSTHGADADRTWALESGADGYLVKPIPVERLLSVAAGLATTRSQSRRELRSGSAVPAKARSGAH